MCAKLFHYTYRQMLCWKYKTILVQLAQFNDCNILSKHQNKGDEKKVQKIRSKYISYQITFKLEIRILNIGFRVISKKGERKGERQ